MNTNTKKNSKKKNVDKLSPRISTKLKLGNRIYQFGMCVTLYDAYFMDTHNF